ncbi:MAG: hypothetical protein ACD_79C00650G0012 [uncultured bacterium]|nr:MAG: hypothetical protein ACD_79C00650G0012 [uncultured bacterium]
MILIIITVILLVISIFMIISLRKKKVDTDATKVKIGITTKTPFDSTSSEIIALDSVLKSNLQEKLNEVLESQYADITPISAGGMGVIYSAFDKTNKRKVAIKTVLPELKSDPRAVKLFFDECNAIKKMNHPNVVRILDVSNNEELYYYVMEALEGENLKKMVRNKGKLSYDLVIKIGTQVSRALQHCHDNRVIHRDIKPSNIFFTDKGVAKIIDFGIVKLLTNDTAVNLGTTKIGSPEFASPEQLQGQPISGKSDVYSLGICLYYVASGKMPFTSGIVSQMFDKPRDIKEFCPDMPQDLEKVIYDCIQLNPAERPRAHEIWARLRNIKLPKPK